MARVLSSRPGLRQLRRLAPARLPESPSGFPQARQCSSDQAGFLLFVVYCNSLTFSAIRPWFAWSAGHWGHVKNIQSAKPTRPMTINDNLPFFQFTC